MISVQKLENDLYDLLKNFIEENKIKLDKEVKKDTRLIGSSSIFDSMELVQFIVEVETFLDESYGVEIQLTSEKAMSRRNSPFISIESLSKYIKDETNE